ncbi:SDR family NAD(P)-dependent oxidoreductase [Gammaproteobacteria bacterium]|mgnify:CR=1 FL=1|jgi:meso-butanediol dehydrogenase/(S,S)-butanediol dehydrogenase/diacetyl reductase|nr:SDR family NAD(P)-dependent oxidoreductase [Gammaproteobacteria bacterium]
MKRFKNKVVLVTGAGSGIGRSTAIRMDAEGANLIIVDINEKDLIKTQSMLKNKESHFKVLDISASEDVKKFFADINKLDALINIAGILRFDNSHEVQIDDWNKILNVNLTGTFFMCSYALPLLIKSKGAIVNVSSTAALGSHAWTAAYSASKGGISAFSKTLAVEYGMKGLNVNCVCPASIETPMSKNPSMPKDIDTRLLKKIMPIDGVNRSPDDVASTIAFLASKDAIHINGIDLRVDGGLLT